MSKVEEFIESYTKNCSNLVYKDTINGKEFNTYNYWLTPDDARRAVEIAREETLDKVCNFLEMLGQGFTITDGITHNTYKVEQLIIDFKTYMED